MEFNISELDELDYDQIPENKPIKIIKKDETNKVRFSQTPTIPTTTPTTTPKSAIKKVSRPHVPEQKPKLSYDDILSKMGMFVTEGQLHLLDNQPLEVQEQIRQQIKGQKSVVKQPPVIVEQPNQNSYIYNKYFSNEMQNTGVGPRVPRSLQEYRDMLLQDFIQKQRIRQMKSTKLIMPTSNINFAPQSNQNMNKLFSFSNK